MSGPGLALVLVAALPGLAAINGGRWLVLAVWAPAWALLVGLAAVPVRGRSATGWAIALVLHAVGCVMAWARWQSKAAVGIADDLGEADLPGVLAGIQIHDGPPRGHTMTRVAVVQNHSAHTWAAVARIVHPGIGLAEPGTRNRMGAGLAELAEIASRTELIDLLAIQVRTVGDDGAERVAWANTHRRAGAPVLARQVNDLLAQMLTPASVRTEAFVTIVVGEDRIAKPARQAGGGLDGRARVLHGAMAEVESRLRAAMGCTEVTWLDSPALAVAIRTGFAPRARGPGRGRGCCSPGPRRGHGNPFGGGGPEPGHVRDAALQPRRLVFGDRHHPAAGAGGSLGGAGAGPDADGSGGASRLDGVLPGDGPGQGGPAQPAGRDVGDHQQRAAPGHRAAGPGQSAPGTDPRPWRASRPGPGRG